MKAPRDYLETAEPGDIVSFRRVLSPRGPCALVHGRLLRKTADGAFVRYLHEVEKPSVVAKWWDDEFIPWASFVETRLEDVHAVMEQEHHYRPPQTKAEIAATGGKKK